MPSATDLTPVRITDGQRLPTLSKIGGLSRCNTRLGCYRWDFGVAPRFEMAPFLEKMALPNGRKGYLDSGRHTGRLKVCVYSTPLAMPSLRLMAYGST